MLVWSRFGGQNALHEPSRPPSSLGAFGTFLGSAPTRVVPATPVNIRLESSQERVSASVPVTAAPSQAWHGQVLGDGDILGQACPVEKACPGPLGSLVAAGGQCPVAPGA